MVDDFEMDARRRFPLVLNELRTLPDDGAATLVLPRALPTPNVTRVNHLGTYRAPTGATLVYFVVDTSGGSVGCVVNLGPETHLMQIK